MENITNLLAAVFFIVIGIGIALTGKLVYANILKSLKKRRQLERARLVKDIRTEVRKYLKELQK